MEFGNVIPAAHSSILDANAMVPEIGALTRTIGEIAIIIISARLAVIEKCRRGVAIFSVSVKLHFHRVPEASKALFCTCTIAHTKSQPNHFFEYPHLRLITWFLDRENPSNFSEVIR